ncbi:hypothetical protein [Bauldia litoralis]|uniref:Uncharacterized protein n=1 Tax=Bauldia litoralis TaxID=665467 RepID=A0A1G6DU56_9HYPH|nr:hypothetical protein [Bauldia litoralis]SDB48679.1 hypothetical protein SAMN02982931_03778 [Bauldia litoralis]
MPEAIPTGNELVASAPFPPEGWTQHPDNPAYYFKGKEVLNEAQIRAKYSRYHTTPVHGHASDPRLKETMALRRSNMLETIEQASTHHQKAIDTLSDIMDDPDATAAQVRACESIIHWASGAPERFIHIALEIRHASIGDAMNAVIAAVADGDCSVEAGESLMSMLKQKAEVSDMALLQAQISELRDMVQTVATGGGRLING